MEMRIENGGFGSVGDGGEIGFYQPPYKQLKEIFYQPYKQLKGVIKPQPASPELPRTANFLLELKLYFWGEIFSAIIIISKSHKIIVDP